MIVMFNGFFDPLGLGYAAVATLFIGSFLMIRFVDFREKNNLSDYSDLMNYKKFLLFSGRDKLKDIDYYDALPFLYAFGIKPFLKYKFVKGELPEWYSGERGSLL